MTRTVCLLSLCSALLLPPAAAAGQEDAGGAQPPPIQARPGGPDDSPRSDETVDVARGTRLVMTNNAGEIRVRTWDRDAVRIEALHGPRERIDVQVAEMTLRVRASTGRGPQGLVDYHLTVPRWMPVNLSGTYLEADIEGTGAEVTVETVRGSIRVRGGSGAVSVRSVQGRVAVENATGRVTASSVNEDIRLVGVSGDVTAESTNGDIYLQNTKATSVDVSTVNGDVTFDAGVQEMGGYRFTTHNGGIRVGLGGAANATVFVRTFQGRFSADFPVTLPEGQANSRSNLRFNFTLGTGSARVELQSFGGNIFIARGTLPPQEERRRRGWTVPSVAPPPPPGAPAAPRPAPRPPGDWHEGVDHDLADALDRAARALRDVDIDATVEAALAGVDIDGLMDAALNEANIEATVETALAGVDLAATVGAALGAVNIGAAIEAALDAAGAALAARPRTPR